MYHRPPPTSFLCSEVATFSSTYQFSRIFPADDCLKNLFVLHFHVLNAKMKLFTRATITTVAFLVWLPPAGGQCREPDSPTATSCEGVEDEFLGTDGGWTCDKDNFCNACDQQEGFCIESCNFLGGCSCEETTRCTPFLDGNFR